MYQNMPKWGTSFPLLHAIKVTPSSGLFSHSCRNRWCQGYTFFNTKHKHLKRELCLCCSLHACRWMFRKYFVIFELNLYKLNLCLLFLSNLPSSKQMIFVYVDREVKFIPGEWRLTPARPCTWHRRGRAATPLLDHPLPCNQDSLLNHLLRYCSILLFNKTTLTK